jgi:carbonic anhydrase/acetyltransferase-like protein (isoleucine patch superfamily)
MLYSLGDKKPEIHPSCFVADSASIIGTVVLEEDASVWFNVVIRGDMDRITVGARSNVQDGSVLHTDYGIHMQIGQGVTVGHMVMLHGCQIGDHSLIGMGSVILNGARIGKHCLIGANSLITEGKVIPDGSVVMGSPGKIVRSLDEPSRQILEASATHYVENARNFKRSLRPC